MTRGGEQFIRWPDSVLAEPEPPPDGEVASIPGSRDAGCDPRCVNCGAEVDYDGQDCPPCRDHFNRELDNAQH